jgi:hypothetical protein
MNPGYADKIVIRTVKSSVENTDIKTVKHQPALFQL